MLTRSLRLLLLAAGPNLAKATAEREEAILRADRAEHSCRQLQQQVARLHQQAASAAAHASSSAEVPASSAEESSADRAAADSNDSTEGASSAAEPAPAESGTSREGANAAELQATREQLQMAQAEVAKLKTAAAEQEEQRGQAATAVEGELSTLREVHVRLQEQYREAQGSLQAAEGAQEHLAAQSEALQEQLHQVHPHEPDLSVQNCEGDSCPLRCNCLPFFLHLWSWVRSTTSLI